MKLYIDKNLNLDLNKANLIGEFCAFCADHLPINGNFKMAIDLVLKKRIGSSDVGEEFVNFISRYGIRFDRLD